MNVVRDRLNCAIALGVFAFSLLMYGLTVQNTVPFWDSGEFIATSYVLGIPHPPGTPLYVLIGRLAAMVPLAEIATRVNFLSSVGSAFSVLLTYLITVRFILAMWGGSSKRERWVAYTGGFVGSVFMAFSSSFWDSAVEAEVYNISSAAMLLCIWTALRWRDNLNENRSDIPLLFIVYVCFLAIGIHLGALLALPPLVFFVLWEKHSLSTSLIVCSLSVVFYIMAKKGPVGIGLAVVLFLGMVLLSKSAREFLRSNSRFIAIALGLAAIGVSVHLYLLIRANLDPPINEADPSTWDALMKVLTRDQYKPPSPLDRRADFWFQLNHMFFRYFKDQFRTGLPFMPWLLPVLMGVLGAIGQMIREKKGFFLMLLLVLITSLGLVIVLNFSANEVRERDYFFIACYHLYCIWIGIGAAMLVKTAAFKSSEEKGTARTPWYMVWSKPAELASNTALFFSVAIVVFLCLLPLIRGNQFYHHNRKNNFVARDYAYNMLISLPQDAILMTNGDNDTFPLWYLQEVEGVRKDVRVMNLSLLNTAWYIKQLRDEEPKVPFSFTDAEINRLTPVRDRTGRVILIKDFAVQNMLAANNWERPVYLGVTVADQMDLQSRLMMEGLSFRVLPEAHEGGPRVDVEETLRNLYEVYSYDGLLDENRKFTDKPYKDDNTLNLIQNYCAAHVYAAHALMREDKLPEAAREMEAAKAISPWYTGLTITLGDLYEQMGLLDKAEAHYKEMFEYHPGDTRIHYKLGTLLSRQGRYDEAEEYLRMGIERSPDIFYLHAGLAANYHEQGEEGRARQVLERWLERHPDDQRVREYLYSQAQSDTT